MERPCKGILQRTVDKQKIRPGRDLPDLRIRTMDMSSDSDTYLSDERMKNTLAVEWAQDE